MENNKNSINIEINKIMENEKNGIIEKNKMKLDSISHEILTSIATILPEMSDNFKQIKVYIKI